MSDRFWRDRSTLVTGATGLLGSWLVPRLVAAGADVVCLVRDWVPQSELVRTGMLERVKVVRGDVRDGDTIERALGEYEIEILLHLAAQTIVAIANRNPISTFETNIQGTWNLLDACRRSPKVRAIVVASLIRRTVLRRRCPIRKRRRFGLPSLRRQQILRRSACRTYAVFTSCRWPSPGAATSTAVAI